MAVGADVASPVQLARTRLADLSDAEIYAKAAMKTTITLYRASDGWRWQMRDARNSKIIGASSEAYKRRAGARENLCRVTGVWMSVPRRLARYSVTTFLCGRVFDRD